MYNDQQSQQQAEKINRFAPKESAVHGASSSLAKALFLLEKYPETELLCHQADWLASSLTGHYRISDENNCLKLGYDSINQCWPTWLFENGLFKNSEKITVPESILPEVVTPGSTMANVKPALIEKYSLAENCVVIAGTTDSNAAVLATGANQIGDAVTSLGSTLVIKLFSDRPLFAPEYGIYSHRLNNHWLVGGASNSGGKTLLQYFTQQQLNTMTPQLKPAQPTGLDYYPLPATGERFPYNDRNKKNRTVPRPDDDVIFFQALLEGIASIEADAYKKLSALGATNPTKIFTAGGGAKNQGWEKIREIKTGVEITSAIHTEASYGSALLAKGGYEKSNKPPR
jgi:sugar (pentulose or hexulose) kinase